MTELSTRARDWKRDLAEIETANKTRSYLKTHRTFADFCRDKGVSCKTFYQHMAKDRRYIKHENAVYVVAFGEYVKIGRTTCIEMRAQTLRVCNPFPAGKCRIIADPDMTLERELHEQFAEAHQSGEWFVTTPELREFLNAGQYDTHGPLLQQAIEKAGLVL